MKKSSILHRVQRSLDAITRKWWLYLLLLPLFFLQPYASHNYSPGDTLNVIAAALMEPLIFRMPILMPIAKVMTALLVLGLFVLGNQVKRLINIFVALLYVALAIFQQAARTDAYGLVVVTGNLALISIVALLWAWEAFSGRNDFRPRKIPILKWWCAPLALFAFLSPIDATTMVPDFNVLHLLTNEAALTYCMMTPLILTILTLYHPTVNLALLRVSAFVGMLFGAVNMIVWFLLFPSAWWMGVLHIPLLLTAIYAFLIGHGMEPRPALGSAFNHS